MPNTQPQNNAADDWLAGLAPRFKIPTKPTEHNEPLSDDEWPAGIVERRGKLARVLGDLIFRTDRALRPFREADCWVLHHTKNGKLFPVGPGPLADFWQSACEGAVFDALFRAMRRRGLPVKTALLLGHCYDHDYEVDGKGVITTIAFLGFAKGTAEDPAARVLARRCALEMAGFLAANGFPEVPCYAHEINIITPQTPNREGKHKIDGGEHSTPRMADMFSPTIGSPIALEGTPLTEGTLGLWMARKDRPGKRYAITCRHVLEPGEALGNPRDPTGPFESGEVRGNTGERSKLRVLLPGDATYERLATGEADRLAHFERLRLGHDKRALAYAEEKAGGEPNPALARNIEKRHSLLCRAEEFRDTEVPSRKEMETRVLGKLAWTPPIHRVQGTGFVVDIAAVEVDITPLTSGKAPANTVNCAGRIMSILSALSEKREPSDTHKHNPWSLADEHVHLTSSPVPEDKIRGHARLPLAMDGRASGLSAGYSCGAPYGVYEVRGAGGEALVTHQPFVIARRERYCEYHRDTQVWWRYFSQAGDSGAWVWDGLGRPAGMVTAGAGRDDLADVTFYLPHYFLGEYMEKEMGLHLDLDFDS